LRPRLAERGQVLAGVAIEHQLVRHNLERFPRPGLILREPVLRDRTCQAVPGEYRVLQARTNGVTVVQCHGQTLLDRNQSRSSPSAECRGPAPTSRWWDRTDPMLAETDRFTPHPSWMS